MRRGLIGLCWIVSVSQGCQAEDSPETAHAAIRAPSAPTPEPDRTERYPVAWSRGLQLDALPGVERRLSAREPEYFGELQLAEAKTRPASCVEWSELRAQGYRPIDRAEEQSDIAAKIRCETLSILKDAKPAAASHVRELLWDQTMLRVLPAAVATAHNPSRERAIAAASEAGKTLKQLDPKARAKPLAGDASLVILEGDRRLMISLHGEAWGDFNRDGVDDILMSVVNGATHGEFSYARLMTVTRKTPDEMLALIDVR